MASIGEQIREARRAKGLTQDDLANALHVGRTVISKWETDIRLPDAEMLLQLSKLLGYSFEAGETRLPADIDSAEASNQQEETVPPAGETESPVETPMPQQVRKSSDRHRGLLIGAAAVLCAALLLWLVVLPALRPGTTAKERAYKSPEGEIYTIGRFQQEAKNEAGRAYLRVNPSVQINHGENYDYWLFEISYHEMNGVALTVDRVEQVIFSKEKENVEQLLTAADLRAFGLSTDIPAYGDWAYSGGLPVQDTVLGAGILLRATDENGAALTFSTWVPLTTE